MIARNPNRRWIVAVALALVWASAFCSSLVAAPAGAREGTVRAREGTVRAKRPRLLAQAGARRDDCVRLGGDGPLVDRSRERALAGWKPEIAAYSKRHYNEYTWRLHPTCIVLHYTAGTTFPWNLTRSTSFAGEKPGLASHFVIAGTKIWQILPLDVRSRGAYGINHRAINIEMVAANARDLSHRRTTLQTCVKLVRWLMARYHISKAHVYSHAQVATMNRRVVPEVLDLVNPTPYHKVDPGAQNMRFIKAQL